MAERYASRVAQMQDEYNVEYSAAITSQQTLLVQQEERVEIEAARWVERMKEQLERNSRDRETSMQQQLEATQLVLERKFAEPRTLTTHR